MKARTSTIEGKITLSDGTVVAISDADLVKNTLYIENQCVNNDALEFGAVYSAECGFTLKTAIDRYKLFDATIELAHIVDGIRHKLGVFTVYDSNRTGFKVSIKALDRITDFDVEPVEEITGSPYQIISYLCTTVGITLKTTKADIEAMPNGTASMHSASKDFDTYRTILSNVCSLLCAFAYMDPEGQLVIAQYEKSPSITLERSDRLIDCTVNDFETTFNGVKCRFLAGENYYPYSKNEIEKRGIVLDLGDNAVIKGDSNTKNAVLQNILDYIKDIEYTPTELNVPTVSDLRLGQMIECKEVNGSSVTVNTLVMKYKWQYRQKEILYSYGENPRFQNVTSSEQRQASHQDSSVESVKADLTAMISDTAADAKIELKTASNEEAVTITASLQEVASVGIKALKSTAVFISADLQVNTTKSNTVTISLFNGTNEIRTISQLLGTGDYHVSLLSSLKLSLSDEAVISMQVKGSTTGATCAIGGAELMVFGQKVEVS